MDNIEQRITIKASQKAWWLMAVFVAPQVAVFLLLGLVGHEWSQVYGLVTVGTGIVGMMLCLSISGSFITFDKEGIILNHTIHKIKIPYQNIEKIRVIEGKEPPYSYSYQAILLLFKIIGKEKETVLSIAAFDRKDIKKIYRILLDNCTSADLTSLKKFAKYCA